MPIYEYRCDACDIVFEEWHRHADDIMTEPCPKCHKTAQRLISNTTFVLKGGGWYVTEYGGRKAESANASEGTATDTAPTAETAAAPPSTADAPKSVTASAAD